MSVRRALVVLLPVALAAALAPPAAAHPASSGAEHSLRASGHRRELLLRDGRPVRERRHRPTTPAASVGDPLVSGFDPTSKGFYNGGDLDGLRRTLDYIQGLGTTAIWLTPSLQEQGGAAGGRPVGRLPRLLDHRLHPGRPAPRHQRTTSPTLVDAAHAARDEGLLRHHHQPHRRRDRLPARAPAGRTSPRTPRPTGPRPASRSTTATTPARTPSRRSTRRRPSPTRRCSTPAEQNLKVAGLAQRRDAVPQPRRHHVHRRELPVRRLLRPRRPVHREPAGGRRDDRHLQDLDRATSASTASASTP